MTSLSFADRHPCPKCGKRADHVSGRIIMPHRDYAPAHAYSFLVCWRDDVAIRVGPRSEWHSIRDLKSRVRQYRG